MPMPSRSQYATGNDFLSALNTWMEASESAYQGLVERMKDAPEHYDPGLFKQGAKYRNVSLKERPSEDEKQTALRMLSDSVLHHDERVVSLWSGPHDGGWAVFAEVEPA